MSVSYSTTLKNTRMDAVTTAIGSAGKLVIGTSSLSGATGVLATITLGSSAFGASSSGVITLSGLPLSASASAGGTAAKAEIRTSADAVIVTGLTVGTSASDIIVGTTTIASGNTVNVTAGTITHAA